MKKKKHDVLVLNKAFTPVHIIGWRRAMSLIVKEDARPLDRDFLAYCLEDWMIFSELSEDYAHVTTTKHKVSIPEIIVLTRFNKLPQRDVKYSRQSLFERDGFKCAYCGDHFARKFLTVDHIIPKCQGGKGGWNNTATSCRKCNHYKGGRTPEEAGMKLKIKPKKPKWISPLNKVGPHHPCKSWKKFMKRVSAE